MLNILTQFVIRIGFCITFCVLMMSDQILFSFACSLNVFMRNVICLEFWRCWNGYKPANNGSQKHLWEKINIKRKINVVSVSVLLHRFSRIQNKTSNNNNNINKIWNTAVAWVFIRFRVSACLPRKKKTE